MHQSSYQRHTLTVVLRVLVTVAKAVHVGVGIGNFDEQKETAGL